MEEPKVPAIGVSPCVKLFMESLFTDSLFTESMIAEAFSIGADNVRVDFQPERSGRTNSSVARPRRSL